MVRSGHRRFHESEYLPQIVHCTDLLPYLCLLTLVSHLVGTEGGRNSERRIEGERNPRTPVGRDTGTSDGVARGNGRPKTTPNRLSSTTVL